MAIVSGRVKNEGLSRFLIRSNIADSKISMQKARLDGFTLCLQGTQQSGYITLSSKVFSSSWSSSLDPVSDFFLGDPHLSVSMAKNPSQDFVQKLSLYSHCTRYGGN